MGGSRRGEEMCTYPWRCPAGSCAYGLACVAAGRARVLYICRGMGRCVCMSLLLIASTEALAKARALLPNPQSQAIPSPLLPQTHNENVPNCCGMRGTKAKAADRKVRRRRVVVVEVLLIDMLDGLITDLLLVGLLCLWGLARRAKNRVDRPVWGGKRGACAWWMGWLVGACVGGVRGWRGLGQKIPQVRCQTPVVSAMARRLSSTFHAQCTRGCACPASGCAYGGDSHPAAASGVHDKDARARRRRLDCDWTAHPRTPPARHGQTKQSTMPPPPPPAPTSTTATSVAPASSTSSKASPARLPYDPFRNTPTPTGTSSPARSSSSSSSSHQKAKKEGAPSSTSSHKSKKGNSSPGSPPYYQRLRDKAEEEEDEEEDKEEFRPGRFAYSFTLLLFGYVDVLFSIPNPPTHLPKDVPFPPLPPPPPPPKADPYTQPNPTHPPTHSTHPPTHPPTHPGLFPSAC